MALTKATSGTLCCLLLTAALLQLPRGASAVAASIHGATSAEAAAAQFAAKAAAVTEAQSGAHAQVWGTTKESIEWAQGQAAAAAAYGESSSSGSSGGGGGGLPLSSSIILFNIRDETYVPRSNGRVASWCAQVGNAARKAGSTSVSVVMTQNWEPMSKNDHFTVKYYCYREGGSGGSECKPFTWDAVDRFREKLTTCLSTLADQGFKTIMITPHVDNSIDPNQWRNYVKVNPTQKDSNGFSFFDIQLKPIAQAVNANLDRGVRFLVNLQGEMGTSMFGWPYEYLNMKDQVLGVALKNKEWASNRIKIGFNINFERVAGYAGSLPQGVSQDGVKKLFDAVDFVAISAYAPLDPWNIKPSDFEKSAQMADNELGWYSYKNLRNKKLYYGEFGVGGGTSPYCDKLASSAQQAASTPQYGTCWQYQPPMDPWRNNEQVRQYMRRYYEQAVQWLKQGGKGNTYTISGVFCWNLVSWDVQGIHPLSYDGAGESFKDEYVSNLIAQHNNGAWSWDRR